MTKEPLKFLADRMLGKLARYLLILGIDTDYFTQPDRQQLIDLAKKQGRVILTRDSKVRNVLALPEYLFIRDDLVENQFRQVVDHFALSLDEKQLFSRCLRCNQPLVKKPPEEIKPFIPPYIFNTQQKFSLCSQCQRVYWKGTHQKRMEEMIRSLFDKD